MNRSLFLLSLGFVGLCNSTDITSSHSLDDDESTTMTTLHAMLDQASASKQRLERIHESNVGDLEFSLLEQEESEGLLRSQTEMGTAWKNPLAGIGAGSAIPYFNGYACVTGVMPGAAGKCIRDKGKALLGCSGRPNKELLEKEKVYASDHCSCSMCGGGKGNQLTAMIGSGMSKKIVWTPFCHTRGFNNCMCGLVDMSIKDEKTCYDLW